MPVSMPSLISLLALAALGVANPVASPTQGSGSDWRKDLPSEVSAYEKLPLGTAVGGALDLPTTIAPVAPNPTEAAAFDANLMTVTLINLNGGPISTVHAYDPASPGPVSGNGGAGRMEFGDVNTFVVPEGFSGNIAINDADIGTFVGDESLIEGSFVNQGFGVKSDIDVSFVNGFSVPIICWCDEDITYTGCSKDLYDYNGCPDYNGGGSCRNPTRPGGVNAPTHFFAPCHGNGGAYTYPDDSLANNLNQRCTQNSFTCCVGTDCPSNPSL